MNPCLAEIARARTTGDQRYRGEPELAVQDGSGAAICCGSWRGTIVFGMPPRIPLRGAEICRFSAPRSPTCPVPAVGTKAPPAHRGARLTERWPSA